jgi:hypothetical protein
VVALLRAVLAVGGVGPVVAVVGEATASAFFVRLAVSAGLMSIHQPGSMCFFASAVVCMSLRGLSAPVHL